LGAKRKPICKPATEEKPICGDRVMATYGMNELAQRRAQGTKPTMVVVRVSCKTKPSSDWWKYSDTYPEIWIEPHESASTLDLFPLTGLSIVLYAEKFTDQASDVFDALQTVAAFVMVICPELDEVGFKWRRDAGLALLESEFEVAA